MPLPMRCHFSPLPPFTSMCTLLCLCLDIKIYKRPRQMVLSLSLFLRVPLLVASRFLAVPSVIVFSLLAPRSVKAFWRGRITPQREQRERYHNRGRPILQTKQMGILVVFTELNEHINRRTRTVKCLCPRRRVREHRPIH